MTLEAPEHPNTITVETTPEHALAGAAVGVGLEAVCARCNAPLGAGRRVRVYAHQMSDESTLRPTRLTCPDCADGVAIETPTLGATEVVADATLATLSNALQQVHELRLADVEVWETSPPDEGGAR